MMHEFCFLCQFWKFCSFQLCKFFCVSISPRKNFSTQAIFKNKNKILAIAMNDVLMTPCHHFQIHVVLNSVSSISRGLRVKV